MFEVTPQEFANAIAKLMGEWSRYGQRLEEQQGANIDESCRWNRKKLRPNDVRAIRDMKLSGESNRNIADLFGVNPATVSRIVRGIYHKEVV
ncbi:helix-turn-helix domain-containing protein [Mycolicibacter minnesotensis]|nr:helix-turn-helix domain-containing protein [Mycolicibacter minnesotensis]BBY34927.1 hypothetical protein MMIN_29880 [Mycolicibacter minnesotensis]